MTWSRTPNSVPEGELMEVRPPRRPIPSRRYARQLRVAVATALGAVLLLATACGTAAQPSIPLVVRQSAPSTSSYIRLPQYGGPSPSQTASLNVFSPDWLYLDYWVLEPLAIPTPPTFSKYVPEIATSWKLGPKSVTIKLRKDAMWQNGSAITSTDVGDSLLVDGIDGGPIWSEITGYSTPNAHTIVLNVKKGIQPGLALYNALSIYPVSPSQYKRFVTPGLEKTLLAAAAGSTTATKATSADLKNLENFAPTDVVGDGPFQLVKMSSHEVLVKKWKGFWAASEIHVPGASFTQLSTNNAVWAAFHGGLLDYAPVGSTFQAVQLMRSTPGGHVLEANDYGNFTLFFNDHEYPFNLTGVRQAIAYLIDRPSVAGLIDAHAPDTLYPPTAYPTGEPAAIYDSFLTQAQVHALNPYRHNPAKAASILEGLGFHKRSGEWYMPNGKQFTTSIQSVEGESDIIAFALAAADELSSFGIKTSSTALGSTTDYANFAKGNFQITAEFTVGETPLGELVAALSGTNFSSAGRGIGFGPVAKVAGLGTVDIPKTLAREADMTSPGSKEMARLVKIWVDFVNKQIPYLTVTNRNVAIPYSTSHFTHWPKASNPLWALDGSNVKAGVTTMIERGYIRPKA